MNWIDKIPLTTLLIAAVLLAVLPLNSTPHLVEKLGMLVDGTLSRPIDIFDSFMHGTPSVLLIIRLFRQFVLDKNEAGKK